MEPIDSIINDENKDELRKAIERLSESQRLCLRLVELEGLSIRVAPIITGSTESHVEYAVKNAKHILRGFLGEPSY